MPSEKLSRALIVAFQVLYEDFFGFYMQKRKIKVKYKDKKIKE
jgi:hypothetical protein